MAGVKGFEGGDGSPALLGEFSAEIRRALEEGCARVAGKDGELEIYPALRRAIREATEEVRSGEERSNGIKGTSNDITDTSLFAAHLARHCRFLVAAGRRHSAARARGHEGEVSWLGDDRPNAHENHSPNSAALPPFDRFEAHIRTTGESVKGAKDGVGARRLYVEVLYGAPLTLDRLLSLSRRIVMDLVDLMYPASSTLQDLPSKYDCTALVTRVRSSVSKCDPKRQGDEGMVKGVVGVIDECVEVLRGRAVKLVKKDDQRWNARLLQGAWMLDEGMEGVATKVLVEPYGAAATRDVEEACR